MDSSQQEMLQPPRLLIADQRLMEAEGISVALAKHFQIVGCVRNGRELFSLVLRMKPDVVATDINLGGADGIEVLRRVQKAGSTVPFVFFSSMTDRASMRHAMAAGAKAYVPKSDGLAGLRTAVDRVLKGRTYISPRWADESLEIERAGRRGLTQRQQQILDLLGARMSSQQIADALGLSRRTVESHRARLSEATRARSAQDLLKQAERFGATALAGRGAGRSG
ncbi:response regulator [Dyella solisilvae]|nr:response regulator transcription factor [Dyella solisilvae]